MTVMDYDFYDYDLVFYFIYFKGFECLLWGFSFESDSSFW